MRSVSERGGRWKTDKGHGARRVALGLALAAAAALSAQAAPPDEHGAASGAPGDTLSQLEKVAKADTASFDKQYRLGVAYLDRDRALEAVSVFQRCTKLRPEEVKSWVNLGASFDAIGRGSEARTAYRRALELRPDDEIAICRHAASLYSNSYKQAAMDTLRVALAKHPSSYCAYFTLGVAFADNQMYKEAIRAWEKVVALAPDTPEALSAKESITTLREMMKTP